MLGRSFSFEVIRTCRAPAATLFRLETDGGHWADWTKPLVVQSSWERQGDPTPGGIGAVRKIGVWPLLMREKTLVYEQDRRHVYALIGPRFPAKGYRGEVIFTPNAAGGTDLRWSGSFTEGLPRAGPVMLTLRPASPTTLFVMPPQMLIGEKAPATIRHPPTPDTTGPGA